MDELELLKKDWVKGTNQYHSYTDNDIYKMLHKKSSSIVRRLFYISIAELVFWIIINTIPLFGTDEYKVQLENLYSNNYVILGVTILTYFVIALFIYLLFKAYQSISVTDNAKKLMQNILKTRKIIKLYVIYNLCLAIITMSLGLYYSINNNPDLAQKIELFNTIQMFIFSLITLLFIGGFTLLIWLFYRLIYGILLKRLNSNYKELKKLEV